MTQPAFPPVDWSKSILGRDVWEAWNNLNAAFHELDFAQLYDLSKRAAEVREMRTHMANAMRNRDREGKT